MFLTPTDISNRALDHCGQDPIDDTLGFLEPSKKARICGRVYDKLRQAELRRRPWSFAAKVVILRAIDVDTMLLTPALWMETTTYFVGSIVSDADGRYWISNTADNLGNQPQNSDAWDEYFGPLSVMPYDSETSYSSGELVYTADGDGTYRVYLSLQSGNSDDPATPTEWDATITYFKNQVVTSSSIAYMSLVDLNINQMPPGAAWTTTFVGGEGSLKWLQIGGAEFPTGVGLSTFNIVYPLGSGPASQSATRNVYRLPAGFLRRLQADPKAGSTSYLGAPYHLPYGDWKLESRYIVTYDVGPVFLRFIADTVDVRAMDAMFCEGLAARMALEICEPLTQSSDKLKTIADMYRHFMTEAGTIDAIDRGSDEFPLDDYIAARA